MEIHSLIIFMMALLNFASFIWAAFKHFIIEDNPSQELKYLSVLLITSQVFVLIVACFVPPQTTWQFVGGISLILFSAALFWWCIRTNQRRPLTGAFSQNLPKHLMQEGPYRLIRHPFYTSYILTYAGVVLASQLWWGLPGVIVPIILYTFSSRHEEEKFARSALSEQYAHYKKHTGRF
ncbi:MAG: isoprenylcysteine carboxylmethyltransferase family protein, partial [Bacteroidota bacterium]